MVTEEEVFGSAAENASSGGLCHCVGRRTQGVGVEGYFGFAERVWADAVEECAVCAHVARVGFEAVVLGQVVTLCRRAICRGVRLVLDV